MWLWTISVCLRTGASCENSAELFVELCKSWRVPCLVEKMLASRGGADFMGRGTCRVAVTVSFRGEYNFTNRPLKVKVKFTLEQAMKAQRGIEIYCTLALTLTLAGAGWSTLLSGLANLDKCRISHPHRVLIPVPSFCSV